MCAAAHPELHHLHHGDDARRRAAARGASRSSTRCSSSLGFSLIFLALGASATLLGRLLVTYRVWISRVGGVLVLVFGLYLLGVFNLGAFARERRIHLTDKPLGYLGTLVVGHRVRRRVDAVHRSDPRQHPHLRGDAGGGVARRRCCSARIRSGSPFRSCSRPWRSSAFSPRSR